MAEAAAVDTESVEMKAAGASAAPVSFSFTRTTGRRRLLAVTGKDGGGEEKQETDFLRAVEGRELQRYGGRGGIAHALNVAGYCSAMLSFK